MIRLTWFQFRTQAVTAAAVLAAFAVLLAATGPHLASLYTASGLSSCHGGSCQNAADFFSSQLTAYQPLYLVSVALILFAPAVQSASPRPPVSRSRFNQATFLTAWPATASGRPSPTSPPAATGPSSGPRPPSTSPWP